MINELIKECVTNHSENPSNQILSRTLLSNETSVQFKSSHNDPSVNAGVSHNEFRDTSVGMGILVTKYYAIKMLNDLDEAILKYSNVTNQPSPQLFSACHELGHFFVIDSLDAFSILSSDEPLNKAFYQIILKRYENFVGHILKCILRLTTLLKRLTAAAIRLQYIANSIHNRISSSPTLQKKEPPIGGVKVGGEQPSSHVAGGLYPLSLVTLKHSTRL